MPMNTLKRFTSEHRSDKEPDFAALREEFPVLRRKTYLNSGSYCALANNVKAAFDAYMDDRLAVGANWDVWITKNEAVRMLMAQVLYASPDEIAVTASASAGLNALASALNFSGPRNKVMVSDFEFPTNAQIWHAQQSRGARVVHVHRDADGYIPAEMFADAIDEQTQLVAITHVCFRNGAKLDIPGIVRLAHAKGAKVLLDCYQSVGSCDIDVKALDVDFAVGGMLKYLLGTAGIGFLYARKDQVSALTPTATGWFAQADVDAMDIFSNVPAPTASRFQAGTPPVPNCFASAAALGIILELGADPIEQYVRGLTGRCMDRLLEAGCKLATPREDAHRGPMVAIRSTNDVALTAKLAERNVVVSCRDGNVRAMFHVYNDENDSQALIDGLLANPQLLR